MIEENLFFALLAGFFGLLAGSFFNVVIYRYPLMLERDWQAQARDVLGLPASETAARPFNLLLPPSACPGCQTPIKPWQNIPIISYLILKGRCSHCENSISARYPLIELLTALTFFAVAYQWYVQVAFILFGLLFTSALLVLSFIDYDTQLLPDQITIPLIWLGLIFNYFFVFTSFNSAFFGAIIGYLSLWSLFWLFKLITSKEGMGYGDFKLFSALGAWLGVEVLPFIILLASLSGIVLFIITKTARGKPMAFGPALALSGWFVFIFYNQVLMFTNWWLLSVGLNW